MRKVLAAMAVLVLVPAGVAHAGDAVVEAPIRQMESAFNKGDAATARAAHVAAPTIVDEFGAPFTWSGPGAFDRWIAALTRAEAKAGKTEGVVALGTPVRESVDGARAYVITPSTYTYRQHGQVMREEGTMTFVLARTKAGWKIAAWTWSSPDGVPVAK